MNDAELTRLISEYAAGDISDEQHQVLQQRLKSDPQARATFREFMDLEASLHTWAAEDSFAPPVIVERTRQDGESGRITNRLRRTYAILGVVASIAILCAAGLLWWRNTARNAVQPKISVANVQTSLGTVLQEEGCVWSSTRLATAGSRFSPGRLQLVSGIAELKFDSGTDVVMDGPSELHVVSADSAQLLAGNVVVHVTELSDGFTLMTPDAAIVDEGTEYAVALDDDATEVHVFDGSVFWEPVASEDEAIVERIDAGEARRYQRSQSAVGHRIPLGMRKFVRRIEAGVRQNAGAALLAYDGFENLAGRIRRGRSGFGWSGGWTSGFRGRGNIGTIVDAPEDVVFGIQRVGLRLLRLENGEAVRRDLEQPLPLKPGNVYYLSFIVQRLPGETDTGRYLEVSLSDDDNQLRRRSRNELAFGVTSDGFPYVKSGGKIVQSAPAIEDGIVQMFVGKILVSDQRRAEPYLRVYRTGEFPTSYEPIAWTTIGQPSPCDSNLSRVRLSVGSDTWIDIDELRIGTTWHSVTTSVRD
jgi:ferric-dicitrate binding protein FerR (iron transport regulator)